MDLYFCSKFHFLIILKKKKWRKIFTFIILMHEYSSSMHIKKLKIAHYPTRKFVQINELCSHFHSQKRKKKEKEERVERQYLPFEKRIRRVSPRDEKVKLSETPCTTVWYISKATNEERGKIPAGRSSWFIVATSNHEAVLLESLRFGNRPRLGTQRHFKRADIRNDYVRRKIMPRAENLRGTIVFQAFFHGIFHRADFFEKINNLSSLLMISKFLLLFISVDKL